MAARQRSLRYLERLRIGHALVTVALTIGLLAWVLTLWQQGRATAGDVILVCTLGPFRSARHARPVPSPWSMSRSIPRASRRPCASCSCPHQLVRSARRQGVGPRRQQRDLRERRVRLSRLSTAVRQVEFQDRERPAGRPGRRFRRRKKLDRRADPALLRHRKRAHPDRRPGRDAGHPAKPARSHRRRAAGHLAVPSLPDGEHPLCPPRSERPGRVGGRRGGTLQLHRAHCRKASTRWSAIAARACREGSASASLSPARS